MKTQYLLSCLFALLAGSILSAGETVRIHLSPDRPVVPVGEEQTVLIKVEVEGAELPEADRPPVNLSLVIDKSGSMSGDRIRYARKGALEAVRRLGSEDIFSLVVFDREVKTLIPAGPIEDLSRVEEIISGIRAGGTTNIHGGMTEALAQLQTHDSDRYLHRAVLLSDGLANVGPRSDEAFAELGRQFSQNGIVVSTIGLGQDYNEQLLAALAGAAEGNNYFVDRPEVLAKIFEEEIGHLVSTVAQGVRLRIQLPDGIEIRRHLGRPVEEKDGYLEIHFHDLGAGLRKHNLMEVVVPAGQEGDLQDLLSAEVTYRVVSDGTTGQNRANRQIRYSRDAEEVEKATDEDVQKSFAALWQAELQEQALTLVRSGKNTEAAEVWGTAAAAAPSMGLSADVVLELEEQAAAEEKVLRMRSYTREEMLRRQTDAYQIRNQQSVGRKGKE
ncbi:MAG: VWA domain-containing protein [Opitutales bacterium]|nr:VWA domain-containing protein [Opitutales bacterium]